MIQHRGLPNLTAHNHQVTSPATTDYNCIAWSAGDADRWWEPGRYWPESIPDDDFGLEVLKAMFRGLGFVECDFDDRIEPGQEKVALYGSAQFYTHAARQLPNGKWTSKLGKWVDIEHDSPSDVGGGEYGEVACIMKRLLLAKE
jgi:hypothetical protein